MRKNQYMLCIIHKQKFLDYFGRFQLSERFEMSKKLQKAQCFIHQHILFYHLNGTIFHSCQVVKVEDQQNIECLGNGNGNRIERRKNREEPFVFSCRLAQKSLLRPKISLETFCLHLIMFYGIFSKSE